jgi:cytochrome c oxidase subunit II
MVLRIASLAVALLITSSPSCAALGQATPWQMGLQDAGTPVGEFIAWFHNYLLMIISAITLFVMGLLLYVIIRFNAKANPVPSKTTHNTLIEILWTVIPVLILVAIAIPSMRLLYLQRDIPPADMTLKIIGNPSWNWTYEYPDLGLNDDKSPIVSFTSYLKPREQAAKDNVPYLLATDLPVVLPINKVIKLIVTSDPEGIIHSWTSPSFGMKIDAIPGRLNEDWILATKKGVYYGQCSELCGKDHAFMPIEVHLVDQDDFDAWATKIKTATAEEARDFLYDRLKAEGKSAGARDVGNVSTQ